MNNITLYYDYVDNQKSPIWLVVDNFNWTSSVIYISINHFNTEVITNFLSNELSTTVLLSDLVINEKYPDKIGIKLYGIEQRINQIGMMRKDIRKLVIRTVDLKEIIYINRKKVAKFS
ncbi:hypothetical protein [Gracilibacillus xinjiangensis]|uniref:Type II toxin-antitoxin system PemK/MazF family toxin n=1 Tax=Gracilibacillus xinjiangensis TaxID=1193282 RepID=A0ABV8WTS8_9BACI